MWIDGSCRYNPGSGGWAAILVQGEYKKELSGGEPQATNNKMELRAALEGLKSLKTNKKRKVNLYTDSEYVRWVLRGVMRKIPKKNARLIAELLEVAENHDVECVKVKGHADIKKNERAHNLAQRESAEMALQNLLEN